MTVRTTGWRQTSLGRCGHWLSLLFTVLLAQVHEKLDPVLGSLEPALQVDLVWALCVLQHVHETELHTVLHPGLHARFLGEACPCTLL